MLPTIERRRPGGVDAVEKLAGLFAGEHRRLAALDDMLWPTHRMGRIGGEDAAGYQPVETHPDRGQVLFYRRLFVVALQRLDIGCAVQRLDIGESSQLVAAHQAKNRSTAR
jgi:hypothetical protein